MNSCSMYQLHINTDIHFRIIPGMSATVYVSHNNFSSWTDHNSIVLFVHSLLG